MEQYPIRTCPNIRKEPDAVLWRKRHKPVGGGDPRLREGTMS
jgi:hypothetical protein